MKIFGAGSLDDIRKCTELGVAGILTNPQGFDEYYKGQMTLEEITKAILDVSNTPVFIQVHGPNAETIVHRTKALRSLSSRVNAKIIADQKGFEAIRILQHEGIDCIATCLFSVSQAAVAAMVGAYGICPFISRAKDAGIDIGKMISIIKARFSEMDKAPVIFGVSLKGLADIEEAFASGADAIALRYPLLQQMMGHMLTEKAEALFAKNWANVKGEDVSYLAEKMNMQGTAE
jgi:TalC/MipB family fructose-6-phosphate aldolase